MLKRSMRTFSRVRTSQVLVVSASRSPAIAVTLCRFCFFHVWHRIGRRRGDIVLCVMMSMRKGHDDCIETTSGRRSEELDFIRYSWTKPNTCLKIITSFFAPVIFVLAAS
jgi:hypothetical protein